MARVWAVIAILVGAPISAEYLAAYMEETGDAKALLAGIVFFGPLYGGAALLIREVAVRNGLGWSGIGLLAAAFGLAMPGLIDLSLFGVHPPGEAGWDGLRSPTLLAPLGISAYPTLAFIATHVLMSIGAPLAVLDALAPGLRGRPLLRWWGIGLLSLAWIVVAGLTWRAMRIYGEQPSVRQTVAVALVVIVVAASAFTWLGRPVTPGDERPIRLWWLVIGGGVAMYVADNTPPTWFGFAMLAVLLGAAAMGVRRYAQRTRWTAAQIGTLAAGALIARSVAGLLSPLPDRVSPTAKFTQSITLFTATLVVAGLVWWRARSETRT